jgi:hypothetical protein
MPGSQAGAWEPAFFQARLSLLPILYPFTLFLAFEAVYRAPHFPLSPLVASFQTPAFPSSSLGTRGRKLQLPILCSF